MVDVETRQELQRLRESNSGEGDAGVQVKGIDHSSSHANDLKLLSVSFLLVFMSFGAIQNLESSVNNAFGLGQTSLGVLYSSLAVFSIIAPSAVQSLGTKRAIVWGFSGYWLFGAANLIPSWWTLLPASVFLGFSASVLWVAQGTYLATSALIFARESGTPESTALRSFNSFFWSLFSSSQIAGNVVALAICFALEGASSDTSRLSPPTQLVLFATLLLCMTAGTAVSCLLREHKEPTSVRSRGLLATVQRMGNFLGRRSVLLLLPTLAYSGFQQAFIWATFTESVVTPSLGLPWVPAVMTAYGLSDVLASACIGLLPAAGASMESLILGGLACQAVALLSLLFCERVWFVVWGVAVLWGVGDAALNTQLSAILAVIHPQQTDTAFACWKVSQSVASALSFFVGAGMGVTLRVLSLLVLMLACFVSLNGKGPCNDEALHDEQSVTT